MHSLTSLVAEQEQTETAPWVLSASAVPSAVPHATRSRRWSGADGVLELHVSGTADGPQVVEHGDLVVCFDGELYNGRALTEQLGARPGTRPVELVAQALARWSDDAFLHIKGIFAVASWSLTSGRLTLGRDPAGMFPLFFSEAGGRVSCATEAGTLLALPWISRAINRAVLADHLSHRWLSYHETHYRDISRVPAGFVATFQNGSRSLRRYWYPVDPSGHVEWVREDELDEFHARFDQAIDRCVGQGRTAIFLSGGFDSVSLAAAAADLAKRRGEAPPIAASLTFPDPSCNEAPIQSTVASGLGLQRIVLQLGDAVRPHGLIQGGVEINRRATMPMMNAWRPAYRALGDAARRQGCRVVITGEGGDEWLTVGPEYIVDLIRGADVANLYRMLATVLRSYDTSRPLLVHNMLWRYGFRLLFASWARTVLKRVAPKRMVARRLATLERRSPDWVSPDPELQRELRARMEAWSEAAIREPEPSGPYGFYFAGFPGSFLHPLRSLDLEEIFASRRRNGLRELQPFWDPELIQFLSRIHPRVLDRGGRSKGLVRQQVHDRFPELGFEKHRKVSASSFFSETVAAEAPRVWESLGGVRALSALGIVDARKAEDAARADVGRIARSGNCRVWEMLNLEAWASARA
jgi:asparagine synthase (glutamine-hydrolysing)